MALPPDLEPRRRALVIVNPAAGRSRRANAWFGRVAAELERLGCTAILKHAGPQDGDVERFVREADAEFDAIAVAGGDGTFNAAVNGLAGNARPIALLPFGTANVLAREIGLPRTPKDLARLIAMGRVQSVWPGRVGSRLFMTMASSGFDAEIVAAVDPVLKRRFGRVAFAAAIAGGVARYRACELIVRADGAEYRATTAIATRTRFYAGPFVIAPRARLAEPILDLVLFQRGGRLAAAQYLLALLRGLLPARSDVTMLRAREVQISAQEPIAVQADGELLGRLPVTIGIAEKPVSLLCP